MESGSTEARGAEAIVTRTEYLGYDAIVKSRPAKTYRIPELDKHLRLTRTKNEARLIREARKAGVRTPCVYDIDVHGCSITMEFIKGPTVKEVLDNGSVDPQTLCKEIGRTIAKLHSAKICHGDLTTSNMILSNDGNICIIDFSMGCSKASTEDIGVDIRLLERAFTSAHAKLSSAFDSLMSEYYSNSSESDLIKRKVEEIRNRGRYT